MVYLDVPREELVRRILAGAAIEGRVDDTVEVIGNRLTVFADATVRWSTITVGEDCSGSFRRWDRKMP